jgi:hypothetical protein
MRRERSGLLGVFESAGTLVRALERAREERLEIAEVFSPVPNEEILALVPKGNAASPIRFVTLGGALAGLVTGFGLALLSSGVWELVVGGKPVYALVPFVVVGFELTILLGAIATLAGLLLFARLPNRRFPSAAYRPEFSCDRYGLLLGCDGDEGRARARELLEAAGALEIQAIGAGAAAETSTPAEAREGP